MSPSEPSEWQRLKEVFNGAVLLPPSRRTEYLDAACDGDADLRREAERLLASRDADSTFLESPAAVSYDPETSVNLVGRKIGPYQVQTVAGAGGMGVVYKAHDTRLNRTVAIKVLPAHLARDPQFRERFDREARAIAAVAHPHICTIHDIGHDADLNFIVMEYLEGETLAECLARTRLPFDRALRYGVEIVSALDKAHAAGIVHRDLKPGNIMLTKSGAKLLDFGLAKTIGATAGSAAVSELTTPGVVIGTVQYMAPEQLQAQTIDARTDIFACGAVLYEMFTGRRAFDGPSQTQLIAAILEHDTPSVSSLQPLVPPSIDRVVQACLAKDPEDRWQSARDLLRELRWIAETGSSAITSTTAAFRTRQREWLAWIAAVVAMLAVIALVVGMFRQAVPELLVTRLDIVTPQTSDPFAFALAPDGRQLVFAVTEETGARLWRRRLDETTAQPLPGTEGASAPFWAPDGRAIGFFADGNLKRLDLDGGLPQVLAAAPDGRGATWSRDGVVVFAPASFSPLYRVPASGGPAVAITRLGETHHFSHRWPQALPDGRVLFIGVSAGGDESSGVYVASLDSAPATRLIAAQTSAAYAPPGYLLLVDQGRLVARTIDLKTNAVGNPMLLAQPVATDSTIWRTAVAVSTTGVLAHRANTAARRQLVWVDRSGARVATVGAIDDNNQLTPALSPDGRRVAVQRTGEAAPHIWIFDSGRDVPIRFRDGSAPDGRPVWSPDSRRLAFLTAVQGQQWVIEKSVGGSATDEKRLVSLGQGVTSLDWSADGRFLLFGATTQATAWDLWALPLDGEQKAFPVVQSPFNEEFGQLSHDGRWVAYQSNESGRTEVYVQPFLNSGARLPVSTGGGIAPRWRRDGRELFYVALDGSLMAVSLHPSPDGSTLESGTPVKLFRAPIVGGGSIVIGAMQQYAVSADGQRFLINMTVGETGVSPISIIVNWPAALKR